MEAIDALRVTGVKPQTYPDAGIDRTLFLPPSFEIIPRLLLLLDDSETESEALADLIRVDPGLTADVLRISNNTPYPGSVRAETVRDAILRLGMREIYRTVVKLLASSVLLATAKTAFARLDLWRHSLAAAVAAQVLARKTGLDAEVAFTIGLLHDLGKIALSQAHSLSYLKLVEEAALESRGVSRFEQRTYRVDHPTIAGQLLEQWNFPEKISASVRFHHEPTRAPRPYIPLAALTYLANILGYRIGRGFGFPEYAANPDGAALRVLDFRAVQLDEFEQEVADELEKEEARFR